MSWRTHTAPTEAGLVRYDTSAPTGVVERVRSAGAFARGCVARRCGGDQTLGGGSSGAAFEEVGVRSLIPSMRDGTVDVATSSVMPIGVSRANAHIVIEVQCWSPGAGVCDRPGGVEQS